MTRIAAREMWELAEPVHAVAYFSPQVTEAIQETGLRGFWMSYFAARVAPLGAVPAEVAAAVVYNFHPAMVERAIPDAWGFASPQAILDARDRGVAAALSDIVGNAIDDDVLEVTSDALRTSAQTTDTAGRPLFAGHAALPWPDDPLLGTWYGCTCLREHRGDGHVAALVATDVGPCASHVLLVAQGRSTEERQRTARGWTDADWSRAGDALQERGWLAADGELSDTGKAAVTDIEGRTDLAARGFVDALPSEAMDATVRTLTTLRDAVLDAEVIPFPNPIGLTRQA